MMEEQAQPVQEIPQRSQPERVDETQTSKSYLKIVLLAILGLIIVAGAIYAWFKIGRKQISPSEIISNQKTPTLAVPTTVSEPTVIPTPDETANWKTYTKDSKNFGSFSMKYPDGWFVTENQTEDPKREQIITTLSKGGYKIEMNAFMDGFSPSGCNFDKTSRNKPQIADYDSYVDIGNPSIELRRPLPPSEYENSLAWSICVKEDASNSFATAFPFSGVITYFTPTNFNEVIIREMDQILSTFRFLD